MLTGRPPFLNTNKNTMLKNLVSIQVPLPSTRHPDNGPFLQKFFENIGISIIATFWLANILIIITTMGIPETFQIPPSEMIV